MARRALAGEALRALLTAAAEEWRATPLYRMGLGGPDPDRIAQWGADPRLGDHARGQEIAAGRWRIDGERLPGVNAIPWSAPPPSPHFAARLHGFSWLCDLAAAEGAREAIAMNCQTWAQAFGDWHPQAWAPELTAERLFAWLCWGRPAFESGAPEARAAMLHSFARQARHLAQAYGDIRDPLIRLKAGAALVLAGAADPPDGERLRELGLDILQEACASQFTPDGLHLSRAPEAGAEALADLMAVDDALLRRADETPALLRRTIPKLASMLRYLQLGDGGLAAFHGGGAGEHDTLARLLRDYSGETRAYRIAPSAGYFRLAAGDVTIVMDCGAAPAGAFADNACASCLAFEMSTGAERLIVNVGATRELSPEWRVASRATNGHSTLILDDALSAEFEPPRLGRAARPIGPPGVSAKRNDDEDGARIEARHEGYRDEFGLVHARTLFLDKAGFRVIGLDQVFRPVTERRAADPHGVPYAIRFHLHPSVAAFVRGPGEVRLETPSGAHWRLRTDAGLLTVEESVYLSSGAGPQRTLQVVIRNQADPNGNGEQAPNRVIWTMTRIDRPTPEPPKD